MFKNDPQSSTYIPVKSVIVFPEAQVDYNPKTQTQARFLIPQFLEYIDPAETRMQFNLTMQGRGRPQPSARAGAHSLIRDVRLQDGTGATTLTEILDYNVLCASNWHYTSNDSINDKRTMFEGLSNNPSAGQSTYWTGNENWDAEVISAANDSKATTLQIQMPLKDGILNGEKVFPVGATEGLRLHLNLDNVSRSCTYQQGNKGVEFINGVKLQTALVAGQGAKLTGASLTPIVIENGSTRDTIEVNVDSPTLNTNPFSVGDCVYVCNPDGTNEERLGIIGEYKSSNLGAPGQDFTMEVCRDVPLPADPNNPQPADGYAADHAVGSLVFVKNSERVNGRAASGNIPTPLNEAAATTVSYTISNLEYLVGSVSPPAEYSAAMMKQMMSGKGLAMDYKTYSTYRVNLTAKIGLTNQLIPATARRAYSCLSVPLSNAAQIDLAADSLGGVIDFCQNYQYVHGNKLIPDRPVPLERYNNTPPHVDALHLIELEKALLNCGFPTRNLQRMPQHFLIGRAFSKYGQVAELYDEDLSLRVEYSSEATIEKVFDHFICHLRRMTISNGRVTAF